MGDEPGRSWMKIVGLLVFFSVVSAMFVWSHEPSVPRWINHDAANALYIGGRLLRGDVLYVDWYYFVTPPIVLWSAGVYWIAESLGLLPSTAFHLAVVATSGLSVAVLNRSFTKSGGLPTLAILAYLSILVLPGLRELDLGQREHLFVLLLIPYLVWRFSGRPASTWVYLLLAYLGFTMMIKPHFIAAIAVTELFFLGQRRYRFRIWATILIGGVAPFALLAVHSTEAFVGFIERAIPYHLSDSYSFFDRSFEDFFYSDIGVTLLCMGAALCATFAAAWWRGAVAGRIAAAAIALALMLYASVVQQGKFFPYHTLPYYGVTLAMTSFAMGEILATIRSKSMRRAIAVFLALGLVTLTAVGIRDLQAVLHRGVKPRSADLLPYLADQRLVMMMTPVVEDDVFRYLLEHDLELMGPWSSHYTVTGLLAIEEPNARRAALRAYFEPLAVKLQERRPDLVLFSPRRFPPRSPTMHDTFVEDYGLFPTPGYEFWKRTRAGWVLYRRSEGA